MPMPNPQPFTYAHAPAAPAGNGGAAAPELTTSSDSDFILTEIQGIINKAAAFDNNVLLQIQGPVGNLWSDAGIDMLSFASANQLPAQGNPIKYPVQIRIPASTRIIFNYTNNNVAALVSVQTLLVGFKVPKQQG